MLETLKQEKFSNPALPEKNLTESITFTPTEWKHFYDEIKLQIESQEPLDLEKATNNARYLTKLDRAFENVEAGKWTEHELIEV